MAGGREMHFLIATQRSGRTMKDLAVAYGTVRGIKSIVLASHEARLARHHLTIDLEPVYIFGYYFATSVY